MQVGRGIILFGLKEGIRADPAFRFESPGMSMVPKRTRVFSFPRIRELLMRQNRTLVDKSCSVHPKVIRHLNLLVILRERGAYKNAVPVNSRRLDRHFISDIDNDGGALSDADDWPWEVVVDGDYSALFAPV